MSKGWNEERWTTWELLIGTAAASWLALAAQRLLDWWRFQ